MAWTFFFRRSRTHRRSYAVAVAQHESQVNLVSIRDRESFDMTQRAAIVTLVHSNSGYLLLKGR